MPNQEPNVTLYAQALEFASQNFGQIDQVFGDKLDQLVTQDTVSVIIEIMEGIETIIPEPRRVYHTVSDHAANILFFAAKKFPDAFDAAMEICERNLFNDAPLPYMLRLFIIKNLSGKFQRTRRKGPPPSQDFILRWVIYEEAKNVSYVFGMSLTRNEASPELSACDVVVEAAARHDVCLKYTTVRDWCIHKDYANFRIRADALSDYLKDRYLQKLGVLRRGKR